VPSADSTLTEASDCSGRNGSSSSRPFGQASSVSRQLCVISANPSAASICSRDVRMRLPISVSSAVPSTRKCAFASETVTGSTAGALVITSAMGIPLLSE